MSALLITSADGGGAVGNLLVTAVLVDGTTRRRVENAYLTASPATVIVASLRTSTDDDGDLSLDLTPNADITPANSCWLVTVNGHAWLISKGAGTETLADAVAVDPDELGLLAGLADLTNQPAAGPLATTDGVIGVQGGSIVEMSMAAIADYIGSGGLGAIATGRVLGNVSGSSAVPTAITGAQVGALISLSDLAAPTATVTLTQALVVGDGSAAHGEIRQGTSLFGPGLALYADAGHANAKVTLTTLGMAMGAGGGSATSWGLNYTSTGLATITGALAISDTLAVTGVASVGNASADGHAVNRTTGDSRYGLIAANRARANHTGSQTASTISDFDTQVRTSRVDQMASATSPWSSSGALTINATAPAVMIGDGTASHGCVKVSVSAGFGAGAAGIGLYANTADTQPVLNISYAAGFGTVFGLGPGGTTANDVLLERTGTNAGRITASAGLTLTGPLAMSAQKITGLADASAATDGMNRQSTLAIRLDQFATPTASVAMGAQKITGLAAGTASTDAVNVSELPSASIGSGRYTCIDHTTRTTLALTQNRGYAGRIYIGKATTFTSAGVEVVTTAAGSGGVCYVSVYDDSAGLPGTRVGTSSSIDVTATGYREVTGQTIAVSTPGVYHVMVHYNGSATVPTLRATATACMSPSTAGADPSGGTASSGVRSSSDNLTSTAPGTWAGGTVISTVPLAWLKS